MTNFTENEKVRIFNFYTRKIQNIYESFSNMKLLHLKAINEMLVMKLYIFNIIINPSSNMILIGR